MNIKRVQEKMCF